MSKLEIKYLFLNYFSKIHFCSYFKTLSIHYLNIMMYFPLLLRNPLDWFPGTKPALWTCNCWEMTKKWNRSFMDKNIHWEPISLIQMVSKNSWSSFISICSEWIIASKIKRKMNDFLKILKIYGRGIIFQNDIPFSKHPQFVYIPNTATTADDLILLKNALKYCTLISRKNVGFFSIYYFFPRKICNNISF